MASIINIAPNVGFDPLADDEVVIKASEELLKEDSFEAQSKGALQISQVNSLMARSRDQLSAATQQRLAQTTDAQGNPTFSTLVADVGNIGQSIFEANAANIQDPTVKHQFDRQFRNEVKGAQIAAKSFSREQQLQFMQQSFTEEHQSLVNSASINPFKPLNNFIDEFAQKLDAGVTLGLFTDEQRANQLQAFRSEAARAQFNALVELDPFAAKAKITNAPELLHMTEAELQDAEKLVDSKLRDVRSESLKAERDQEAVNETQRKLITQDITNKIEAGVAGQADLVRAKALMNAEEYARSKQQFNESKKRVLKADRDHQKVMSRITNGDNLSGFTSGQIQDSFNRVTNQMRVQFGIAEGEPIPLSLKASVARVFKGRIKSLEQELEHALESGSMEDAVEAVNSYRILSQENPEFTNFLHQTKDKAGEIASYALQLVDKTDVPEQAAIQRARGAILNADDVERSDRGKRFSRLSAFTPKEIGETAREALGGDPLFGLNRRLAPGVVDEFHDLARESFIISGDRDAAIASATNQMNRFYGETSFNNGRLIMFAPPEKMFPGVKPARLQTMLHNELTGAFPNIDSSKVEIVSDDITRAKPGFVSYGLQIRDAAGNPVPLLDPNTGQLLRWTVNQQETIRQGTLAQAREAREEQTRRRAAFGSGLPEETIIPESQLQKQQEAKLFEELISDIKD
jgi:hypothetical protein